LQYTATQCKTLQHAATRSNTLQHAATRCNTLQRAATRCNTLQHTTLFEEPENSFVRAKRRNIDGQSAHHHDTVSPPK